MGLVVIILFILFIALIASGIFLVTGGYVFNKTPSVVTRPTTKDGNAGGGGANAKTTTTTTTTTTSTTTITTQPSCVVKKENQDTSLNAVVIKNKNDYCIDSDGNKVYNNKCDYLNKWMEFSLQSDNTIKHTLSGKCLTVGIDSGKYILQPKTCDKGSQLWFRDNTLTDPITGYSVKMNESSKINEMTYYTPGVDTIPPESIIQPIPVGFLNTPNEDFYNNNKGFQIFKEDKQECLMFDGTNFITTACLSGVDGQLWSYVQKYNNIVSNKGGCLETSEGKLFIKPCDNSNDNQKFLFTKAKNLFNKGANACLKYLTSPNSKGDYVEMSSCQTNDSAINFKPVFSNTIIDRYSTSKNVYKSLLNTFMLSFNSTGLLVLTNVNTLDNVQLKVKLPTDGQYILKNTDAVVNIPGSVNRFLVFSPSNGMLFILNESNAVVWSSGSDTCNPDTFTGPFRLNFTSSGNLSITDTTNKVVRQFS